MLNKKLNLDHLESSGPKCSFMSIKEQIFRLRADPFRECFVGRQSNVLAGILNANSQPRGVAVGILSSAAQLLLPKNSRKKKFCRFFKKFYFTELTDK